MIFIDLFTEFLMIFQFEIPPISLSSFGIFTWMSISREFDNDNGIFSIGRSFDREDQNIVFQQGKVHFVTKKSSLRVLIYELSI